MEIQKIDNLKVNPSSLVRVKEMGNIVEVMWSESYASKCTIRKLDKDHYVELESGEIKEFKHIQNRACDLKSVSKSLRDLRDYLNTNITDPKKCKWITLTYKDNMRDTEKLYHDFRNFNKRLRKEIGHYEYIVAMEPQGRGAWHCHVVMIFDYVVPFIHNDVIWKAWSPKGYKDKLKGGDGYNYTYTKPLDDVDNVGAYLTAYMGDMELKEYLDSGLAVHQVGKTFQVKEIDVEGKTKKYIKGARLYMYPPQFNLYRCSRGVKKPIVTYQLEGMVQKKVSSAKLTYEKTILLSDKDNDFKKTINYRYYNSIRK